MAAELATPGDVAALRKVLEEEHLSTGDFSAFAAVSWRFHTALMSLSGNAAMAIVAESLQRISERHAARGLAISTDSEYQQRRAIKAHHKLVDLIEKRAGSAAESFWAGIWRRSRRSSSTRPKVTSSLS